MTAGGGAGGEGRSRARLWLLVGLLALATLAFAALGTWQVQRRAWKLDLIARVDRHLHAPPAALPAPAAWPRIGRDDEYRRVRTTGRFLDDRETLVQALTDRGAGYWVVTPLATPAGTVLVNRGFVPEDRKRPATRRPARPGGPATVTGLLRLSEPEGRILRPNDPAADRWFSRDVAAIAARRRLGPVAPFFIDADATPNPGGLPVGGLTVISFPNNHLVYLLTWYGLALLSLWGLARVLRGERER